jgi:hypothetical protein
MQKKYIAWLAAALWGCADRNIDLGMLIDELHREGDDHPIQVSGCRSYDDGVTARVCVIDPTGNSHVVGNTLVTGATPPYGAYVEFEPGFELAPASLPPVASGASIYAYAAPGAASCCEPQYAIAFSTSVPLEGGLMLTIDDALPVGTQITFIVVYDGLFGLEPEGVDYDCSNGGLECPGLVFSFFVGQLPQ